MMEKAFTYMLKDSMLKEKALCYFVLAFGVDYLIKLGNFYANNNYSLIYIICAFVFALILYIPFYGYLVACIKAIMEQDDNIVLPLLNFGKTFIFGLKYLLACMIIGLLYAIISVVVIVVPIALMSVGYTILGIILFILAILLVIFSIITLMVYSPVLVCIFAKTGWMTSFCRFIRATKLIKNTPSQYFISLLVYVGIAMIVGVIDTIASLFAWNIPVMITGSLVSAALATFVVFVTSYIIAKCVDYRLIEE